MFWNFDLGWFVLRNELECCSFAHFIRTKGSGSVMTDEGGAEKSEVGSREWKSGSGLVSPTRLNLRLLLWT